MRGNVKLTESKDGLSDAECSSLNLSVKESGIIQAVPRVGFLQEGCNLSIKFNLGDYLVFYYRKL